MWLTPTFVDRVKHSDRRLNVARSTSLHSWLVKKRMPPTPTSHSTPSPRRTCGGREPAPAARKNLPYHSSPGSVRTRCSTAPITTGRLPLATGRNPSGTISRAYFRFHHQKYWCSGMPFSFNRALIAVPFSRASPWISSICSRVSMSVYISGAKLYTS